MKLFITQNSYFFMHRIFLEIYENRYCKVLYVSEKKRGFFRKIKEIYNEFGFFNFFFIVILEFIYCLLLFRRKSALDSEKIHDFQLNEKIKILLESNKFNGVYSIGCPTKIDSNLQSFFGITFYNLHGGILPYQTGRFSPLKALKRKDDYLGATLHEISEEFDEGGIIKQDLFKPKSKSKLVNYVKVLKVSKKILSLHLKEENYKSTNLDKP